MITSLCGSILAYFDVIKLNGQNDDEELSLVHNLAQFAHCLAQGKIGSGFDVSAAVYEVRHLLREMSSKANVPVEPPEQTKLLDASSALPGVLMAGVPGAGGFDAIFVIYFEPKGSETRSELLQLWSNWTEMKVAPLLGGDDSKGLTVE
ncbi:phosphomevalonate kinase [Phlyctochytrium bullatum]|nr:phosphomevalonate kinase [Phlyctochytrium bullatum]